MCLFWHSEGYIPQFTQFDLPKLSKRCLPVLTAEQLKQIVKACNVRDKAIVLFMADSGLRRQEVVNLNWSDVDMQSGLVRVKQGRDKKEILDFVSPKSIINVKDQSCNLIPKLI